MKRFLVLFFTALFAFSGLHAADEMPFLDYKFQGSLSPFQEVQIHIAASGRSKVAVKKQSSVYDYEAPLSGEELSALRALIRASDFFSLPDKETQIRTDAGLSEIAIILEDEKRTLKFSSWPELQPILEVLWKFVAEAEAWHELTTNGDLSAVTNLKDKTLQPARLKIPLQKYLLAQKDRRKIQQAADVLSSLTTPEELVGFLTEMQASDPANRFLAFVRGDPKRVHALCPLYLKFAKENYPRQPQLSQSEKEMLDYAIGTLVDARYTPMIPILLSWFDANTEPRVNAPWSRVALFGADATRALIPKLDSKEAVHRQNAIELLTMNARLNPQNRYSNPISEQEYGSMKEIFAKRSCQN